MKYFLWALAFLGLAAVTMFSPLMAPYPPEALAADDILPTDSMTTFGALQFKPDVPATWAANFTATDDSFIVVLTAPASSGETGIGTFEVWTPPFKAAASGWHDLSVTGYRMIPGGECAPNTAYAGLSLIEAGKQRGLHWPLAATWGGAYANQATPDSMWLEADKTYQLLFYGGMSAADNTSYDVPVLTLAVRITQVVAQ